MFHQACEWSFHSGKVITGGEAAYNAPVTQFQRCKNGRDEGGGKVGRENQEEGKEPSRRREGEAESHRLQCCAVFLSPYTFLLSKSCYLPQIRVTPHISAWWHVGSEAAKNSMVKSWRKKDDNWVVLWSSSCRYLKTRTSTVFEDRDYYSCSIQSRH